MKNDFGFTVKQTEKKIRQQTVAALTRADAADGSEMNRLVDAINRRTDELVALWRTQSGARVACGQGCSWCCYTQVHPTAPEVLRIADHIRDTFSDDEREALLTRLEELDRLVRGLTMRELMNLRLPCALLVDGRCSVYRVRPLICRGWNSTSERRCAAIHTKTETRSMRSGGVDEGQLGIMHGMRDRALCEGIKTAKLDDAFFRLPVALLIALTDEGARRKWLDSEPIFEAARSIE